VKEGVKLIHKGEIKMKEYPKFEKVNDHIIKIIAQNIKEMPYQKHEIIKDNTIRVYFEHAQDVPLENIIETKKKLEEKVKRDTEVLKNINEILENAERLGITPKPKEEKPNGKTEGQ